MCYLFRAVARFVYLEGGGGGQCLIPETFFEPRSGEDNCFRLPGGPGASSPGKVLK